MQDLPSKHLTKAEWTQYVCCVTMYVAYNKCWEFFASQSGNVY